MKRQITQHHVQNCKSQFFSFYFGGMEGRLETLPGPDDEDGRLSLKLSSASAGLGSGPKKDAAGRPSVGKEVDNSRTGHPGTGVSRLSCHSLPCSFAALIYQPGESSSLQGTAGRTSISGIDSFLSSTLSLTESVGTAKVC